MSSAGHDCVAGTPPSQLLPAVHAEHVQALLQRQFPHIDLPTKPPAGEHAKVWYEQYVVLRVQLDQLARLKERMLSGETRQAATAAATQPVQLERAPAPVPPAQGHEWIRLKKKRSGQGPLFLPLASKPADA